MFDQVNIPFSGLDDAAVKAARKRHGTNRFKMAATNTWWVLLRGIIKEPMILLLLIAAAIYFWLGDTGDALFMLGAIFFVAGISLYQDYRSKKAVEALKTLTQPQAKVIRNNSIVSIPNSQMVMGDVFIVEEGTTVPADGKVLQANDFSLNESILTGESLPVFKSEKEDPVFMGTHIASGLAICEVTALGNNSRLGKIGKSMEELEEKASPLQVQINDFVKKMAVIGLIVFALVWLLNYLRNGYIIESLLQALTLAMSILPEEIPVAFSTFMALGAWRLMKAGIIVKQTKTVEALGAANVICLDKTGTITENKMSLSAIYNFETHLLKKEDKLTAEDLPVIEAAMWGSEPVPFDGMEIALHASYETLTANDQRPGFDMVHEYPLSGKPPVMTHVFENKTGKRHLCMKGAPEAVIEICHLEPDAKTEVNKVLQKLTMDGYRVLGVARSFFKGYDFPKNQQELPFEFKGLVAFYDPPKQNISKVLDGFLQAGINIKILTGDNPQTTETIAREIDFKREGAALNGAELLKLSEENYMDTILHHNIFTRMFPEAKLKVIQGLQSLGNIVAMTGDGVNDGPALKAADIGIAMGKRGTEIAKQASPLILMEDDLHKMLDAIAMGRRIYANLKKAIQYIISIHIPIILTVFLPLVLGWVYPNIFTPVHVIFFELIMGPTCSIIYENEPMEPGSMQRPPRKFTVSFFNSRELGTSIIQGLAITLGVLCMYQFGVSRGLEEAGVRSLVFTTLISANIFLTLVNRSFHHSILKTLRYKNPLIPIIIFITVGISAIILFVPTVASFFQLEMVAAQWLIVAIVAGAISVLWFELIKYFKRTTSD